MAKVSKKDADWLIKVCFGRHKDPVGFMRSLPVRNLVYILLTIWEGSK
jgi:hypothetical protein